MKKETAKKELAHTQQLPPNTDQEGATDGNYERERQVIHDSHTGTNNKLTLDIG